MALQPGTTLRHYEIVSALGAGGMGEVYRAKDTKLGRDVAIKLLLAEVSTDPERLARFEREARVLASLNHSNVATLHGFEKEGDTCFLVMELVEGETLADRLARGPIPFEEAVAYFLQIARGLEAAHDSGVIHRDLKPANIKISDDGSVKILDFGLAKATATEADASPGRALSMSPTLTLAATQRGEILGTAAYMSPEQARGKPIDKRTDVWAFGVCLLEALTGRSAFSGEDAPSTLAKVLETDPEIELPTEVPLGIAVALERCLRKDPSQRTHDIADVRIALEEPGPAALLAVPQQPTDRARFYRLLPWLVAVAGVAIAAWAFSSANDPPERPRHVRRFDLSIDTEAGPVRGAQLSPLGDRLVYEIGNARDWQLFTRQLSTPGTRPLEGTEGARPYTISPDGAWVAFVATGRLQKTALTGGAPELLAEAANSRGVVWTDDGIVFSATTDSPLARVSVGGGPVEIISTLDASERERSHRWPATLPIAGKLLFTVAYEVGNPLEDASVAVLDLESGVHRILLRGGGYARYAPSGHLVYARSGSVIAVPFDVERLQITGTPVTVLENVQMSSTNGAARLSFSNAGDLVYVSAGESPPHTSPLYTVSREGSETVFLDGPRRYEEPRFSRDGRFLSLEICDPTCGVWLHDVARGSVQPVTRDGVSYNPVISRDGEWVAYEAFRDGVTGVLVSRTDGTEERRVTSSKRADLPTSWSPDGKTLAVIRQAESGFREISMVEIEKDPQPRTWIAGPFNAAGPRFSPDGRWVAYVTDESGRDEVYLASYPDRRRRLRVSIDGGSEPVWRPDGRELFFRNGDEMLAVEIDLDAGEAARPELLFSRFNPRSESGALYDSIADYDVFPDGRSFVMPGRSRAEVSDFGHHLVQNWFEELKRLAPKS